MSYKIRWSIIHIALSILLLTPGFIFSQINISADDLTYDLLGEPYYNVLGKPWGAHEGLLHGVPSNWDWYWGARPGAWMEPGDNKAVNLWAQAYEWQEESPETNIRIQVRNMKLCALVDGQWRILAQGNDLNSMEGSNYKENFQGSADLSDVRSEKDNDGGISFNMIPDYNYHWWVKKWPRATFPDGVRAFYSVAEMRLIPDTDSTVDLGQAKYLASIGNDYYTTTTTAGPGPWPSLAIARHKFITVEWQAFTAYISGGPPQDEDEYRDLILSQPLPPGINTTSIQTIEAKTPATLTLQQNYPNPFNSNTVLTYSSMTGGRVRLTIYDLKGRTVNTLVDQGQHAGLYRIRFNGDGLASGTYLAKLQIADQYRINKMLLIR
jgi:hypothetical protein